MLSEATKELLRATYRRLADSQTDFRNRFGQRQMIGVVAQTLALARQNADAVADGRNLLAIEGRTGVGKTFGYLLPAIVLAKANNKKLVVSTATVGLQEQLFDRDLPSVSHAFAEPISFGLAKGRGRYVCLSRLFTMSGAREQEDLLSDAVWDRKPEAEEIERLEELVSDLGASRWEGDRDTLSEPLSPDLWSRISTDSHGCTKRRCAYFAECPYYKARNALSKVDVIVANHDLVLSCLSSQSKLLPSPIDTCYVFDEAHHLPSIAISRFQSATTVRDAARWIERVGSVLAKIAPFLDSLEEIARAQDRITQLVEALNFFGRALDTANLLAEKDTVRFAHGELPEALADQVRELANIAQLLAGNIQSVSSAFEAIINADKVEPQRAEALSRDLGMTRGRLENVASAWEAFAKPPPPSQAPPVKWITRSKDRRDYIVHAAPVTAADVLTEHLWTKAGAVVMTSATMTSLGSFDYFLRDSGLSAFSATTTCSVDSPFDYRSQGVICTPRLQSDPRDAEAHTTEIVNVLPEVLGAEPCGTLVLFASRKQMQAVFDQLPAPLQSQILVQGSMSRAELIGQHIERVEGGAQSILFGLAGLGEGLDLPGKLCAHVVIAKIPFAPPDSPQEEALAEWIETQGGNPFAEISLPRAGFLLVQWAGRLIRTESDTGRVTILDSRINTRSYGRRLLAGLPPMRRMQTLAMAKTCETMNS